MTFTEIATEVTEDLNLTSATAIARVGREINIRYRGLLSSIGINKTSKSGSNTQASVGSTNEITFTSLNKITRVVDFTGSVVRELDEVTWDEIRELTLPSGNTATRWATKTAGSITVVVAFDTTFTDTSISMRADGFAPVTTLSGSTEPIFPQDFHDILVWGVKADEYMKMEKPALAKYCEMKAAARSSELRLYIATNLYLDKRQAGNENLGIDPGSRKA